MTPFVWNGQLGL